MKDLLDKLSSYNIFNYLLPGVLLATLVDTLTSYRILQKDLITGIFVYYFCGSIVSRIGSLLLEPLFKKTRIITFAPYKDFVNAAKSDPKLEILSESNNMYRTICALMITIGAIIVYEKASIYLKFSEAISSYFLMIIIFFIYMFSHMKQSSYIIKRIEANNQ